MAMRLRERAISLVSEPMTTFLIDYFKAIDLFALAGLAALACAALFRNGSVWRFVAGVIVAI